MSKKVIETLARELETERLGNVRRLASVRLFAVSAFFALHLALGWGLGLQSFRAKRTHLFSLLNGCVASLGCIQTEPDHPKCEYICNTAA
ncbi:MAG: hypothetical protein RL189_2618 [Pseudomonadota bacterium]